MSKSKADRLLNRITNLHHSLQAEAAADGSEPSALERDLMLGYLRDFYEIYSQPEVVPTKSEKIVAAPKPKEEPVPPPSQPEALRQNESDAHPLSEPSPPDTPPEVPSVPVPPPPPPVVEAKSATVVTDPPRPRPPVRDPQLDALFEDPDQKHFATHAMRQPVGDLTRALSIHNRALFAKKLFGNDGERMRQALRELNLKGSMNYARPMLSDLALQYGWLEEPRLETAREFINLVRRRYD